jgi:membrane protease YdiL (CAAX protease family)
MWGLVITELGILVFAVVSALASGLKLRAVFRFRKVRAWEWRGCCYLYLGLFFLAYACSALLATITPEMTEVSQELNSFMTSTNFGFALIAVCILPGICEEAWHRGTLLSSLGSIKGIVLRVVIMGIVFGLFHLDPYRFLPTMVLGMGLSYMRIKTDNMLLPMVFHTINNLIPLTLGFLLLSANSALEGQGALASATDAATQELSLVISIATIVFALALGALFVYLGRTRLNTLSTDKLEPPTVPPLRITRPAPIMRLPDHDEQSYPPTRTRTAKVVIACSILAFISCIACLTASFLTSGSL